MKPVCSLALWTLLLLPTAAWPADFNYRIVDRIKVPDGGFDYATSDPTNNRVLFARTDFTTVIDTRTGAVSQLSSGSAGHMAVPVTGTSLVLLPQRKGTARIVDTNTDKVIADVPAGKGPDGAIYDFYSHDVFVMNHDGGDVTVVDPIARSVVATIPVGGTLEFPASNDAGKVFDNVTSVPEIAVMDVKKRAVVNRYPLAGCKGASGLAYDPQADLLISSCGNGMAKILNAKTGKEVASLPIGKGPDAVIYDPVRQIAFIPCGGDGVLEVIPLADPKHISVAQTVQTQAGSRTGTLDPKTGRLYLMASLPDTKAAIPPGARAAPRLAGSYEILVVGP
jgi:YVTN family beta-propeller protein